MSFDVFFQPCRFSGKTVEMRNPFTGNVELGLLNEPLNAAELQAVQNVLSLVTVSGPDPHGCYLVRVGDGCEAEVYGDDLTASCMVALRGGITPDLLQVLYDLLKAGNWVMLPAMEDSVAITTSPGHLKGIPEGFPKIVICNSGEELGLVLTRGVKAWQQYRDQVVGQTE